MHPVRLYRVTQPSFLSRRQRYLGHWYAISAQAAKHLAKGHHFEATGQYLNGELRATISTATQNAFNLPPKK